jgi:alpha-glucosidase (family GH31 glycosyl hydrolase)
MSKIAFTSITSNCLRITVFPDQNDDPYKVLNGRYLSDFVKSIGLETVVDNSGEVKDFEIGQFRVSLKTDPLIININDESGDNVQSLQIDEANGDLRFPLGDKEIYGLGQGFPTPMDRRGEFYDMKRHGQERASVFEYATVSAVPYLISREGWGLFIHEPVKGTIDLGGDEGIFAAFPKDYRDVFVMRFDVPADSANLYYILTGKSPIPPKYAFGYQQSYRELVHNGESIVMPTARYMRENDIPCDLLVYLGRYVHEGWNTYTNNGMFEFNKTAFPHPEKMIDELHDMNYRVAFHITETPSGLHGRINDDHVNPMEYDHAKNYWDRHIEFNNYAQNDGWWPDDGDELDLVAVNTRHQLYADGTEQLTPGKRGFYMLRNSYCGDTQHGGVIWSGDVLSKWETLKNHIYVGLNVGMSLSPYWGSDIGGFYVTDEYSGELYIRWFEYSVFCPMFRSHGRHSFLHMPWGWKNQSLSDIPNEWVSGVATDMVDAVLPDYRVEPICKKFIELRYRLIPYIYSYARTVYDEGAIFMSPLWFDYPDDEEAVACDSQYMFGSSMMVNPVTKKGVIKWDTYLPAGNWYDFFSNELIEGGQTITRDVELSDIPVYVRAGSILPMGQVRSSIGDARINPLDDQIDIYVYEGDSVEYCLYEDDGISMEYKNGNATYTNFHWDETTMSLSVEGRSTALKGQTREFKVVLVKSGRQEIVACRYE